MSRRRALLPLAFASFVFSVALTARDASADPSAADRAQSEAAFKEGRQLAEGGKWSLACVKFAESQRLDPQIGTLLYLATCHEKEGKLGSAIVEYAEARKLAANAGQREREKIARERAAAIEPRVAHMMISTEDPAPGLEVKLDGNVLQAGAIGSLIPLDLGEHVVAASAPGREPTEQKLMVGAEGETAKVVVPRLKELAVAAPPPPPPPPAPEAPPENDGNGQRTFGFVIGGVGVVALGAGAFFGVRALGLKSDADKLCDAQSCTQEGLDKHDQAQSTAHLSTVGLAVGVLGVGIGTVLVLTAGGSSARAEPPKTGAASLTFVPSVDARGGGFSAAGRF